MPDAATTVQHGDEIDLFASEVPRLLKSCNLQSPDHVAKTVRRAFAQKNAFTISISSALRSACRPGTGVGSAEVNYFLALLHVKDRGTSANSTTGLKNSFGVRPRACLPLSAHCSNGLLKGYSWRCWKASPTALQTWSAVNAGRRSAAGSDTQLAVAGAAATAGSLLRPGRFLACHAFTR